MQARIAKTLTFLVAVYLLFLVPAFGQVSNGNHPIDELLETVRQRHGLPALGGAIVTSKGLVAIGAVGVRKAGTKVPVTVDDQWHLGSDTKAMTATVIARLVEQGRLKWEI